MHAREVSEPKECNSSLFYFSHDRSTLGRDGGHSRSFHPWREGSGLRPRSLITNGPLHSIMVYEFPGWTSERARQERKKSCIEKSQVLTACRLTAQSRAQANWLTRCTRYWISRTLYSVPISFFPLFRGQAMRMKKLRGRGGRKKNIDKTDEASDEVARAHAQAGKNFIRRGLGKNNEYEDDDTTLLCWEDMRFFSRIKSIL